MSFPSPTAARASYDLAVNGGASVDTIAAARAELIQAERADETDEQTIARLEREARAHDACALRHDEMAAEFYGKAAYQRQGGEAGLAAEYQARANAADDCSEAEMGEAMRLRRNAAMLKRRLAEAAALLSIPQPQGSH